MDNIPSTRRRWRELRKQGAELDAAERATSGERHLKAVSKATSTTKPLGLVCVVTPSHSLAVASLKQALEGQADVRIVGNPPGSGSPSCVVLYAEGMEEGLADGIRHISELYPGVPLLVFGSHLDLALALAALKNGADGFVHAAMDRKQVVRAVEVVQKGELAVPRLLLPYLISQEETPEVEDLSVRQREILGMVAEGLSNAEIAGHLYLTESTIKQHLRAAYKLLGVRNRTEAAKTMKHHARGG